MEETLYALGFSKNRARLYQALLRADRLGVGELSRRAGVPANKAYAEMDALYREGYVTAISQKPLVYAANDPKVTLSARLDARMEELAHMKRDVDRLQVAAQERGNVTIIYGRKNFFEHMKRRLARSASSVDATVGSYRQDAELLDIEKDITSRGVRMRFVGPHTKSTDRLIKNHVKAGVEVRTLSPENVRFTIYDRELVIFRMHEVEDKDYFSIWVESPALSRMLASYFESLWKKARPFSGRARSRKNLKSGSASR